MESETELVSKNNQTFLNKSQVQKRYFCFNCGNNGKQRLRKLSVSNKTFYVCADCCGSLGGESACADAFRKVYNPAESFSMSNLQLTTFVRHLKNRIETLEKKMKALETKILGAMQ